MWQALDGGRRRLERGLPAEGSYYGGIRWLSRSRGLSIHHCTLVEFSILDRYVVSNVASIDQVCKVDDTNIYVQ
jgi:hypothetical protein